MIKKIIVLFLLLVSFPCFAGGPEIFMGGNSIVYSGTITGLRISGIDGTAFLDNCSDITGFANGNYKVTITDNASKTYVGYLKAVGTSETVGSEVNGDSGFDSSAYWTLLGTGGTWVVTSVATGASATTTDIIYHPALITGDLSLYKTVLDITVTSGACAARIGGNITDPFTNRSATGTYTQYFTSPATASGSIGVRGFTSTPFSGTVNSMSFKKVLTPSSSGCTIVSTKGGTTYNFTSKDSGFEVARPSYTVVVSR